MRMNVPEVDLSKISTIFLANRDNKVHSDDLAKVIGVDRSFKAFISSLPNVLEAKSFNNVVDAIVKAKQNSRPVVCMLGGHVIKTGLAPILIDLMARGIITFFASNGAAAIHDYEMTRWGGTSEMVETGIIDGTFGMVDETGSAMNRAIGVGRNLSLGLGEALARDLKKHKLVAAETSLLLQSYLNNIPFTVHVAIGADIIHQHPLADGAAIGDTTHRDFRRLAAHLSNLDGGVVLNIGSAVMMPEVFLKALTVCRNINDGAPREFVTVDFDMIRHYRPQMNVVKRPTSNGGHGYHLTGHHEIMIPLLAWAVVDRLNE